MLTEMEIKNAKPGRHSDGRCLYLKVTDAGTKSWVLRYKFVGKRIDMGLGPLTRLPAKAARTEATKCLTLIAQGTDPLQQRQAALKATASAISESKNKAVTFDKAAVEYIEEHRGGWRNAKHAQQWENTLSAYASKRIGDKPAGDITTEDVLEVLRPIWRTKTETASRLRSRIELILDFARARGWREGENPARWRGHLDKLIPSPKKLKPVTHHAALTWRDIGSFFGHLRQCQGISAHALEFTILTASRSGEVRLATWSEINLDDKVWIIPANRMKGRREHRVPLSEAAVELLKSLPRIDDESMVFPGARKGRPLSDMSLSAVLKRMDRSDLTVHGFRSTFRDWAAEATHYQNHVIEMALAHAIGNAVEAAYRRGDLFEKRRALMSDWAAYCVETKVDNVISLMKVA